MAVKVLVLNTLGDLVKKICELEILDRELSRDNAVQMTAYYEVLKQWPNLDIERTKVLVSRMLIQLSRFKTAEQEMENCLSVVPSQIKADPVELLNTWNAAQASRRYVFLKKQLRATYEELNKLGKYIGTPPVTLEVANEESNTVSVKS